MRSRRLLAVGATMCLFAAGIGAVAAQSPATAAAPPVMDCQAATVALAQADSALTAAENAYGTAEQAVATATAAVAQQQQLYNQAEATRNTDLAARDAAEQSLEAAEQAIKQYTDAKKKVVADDSAAEQMSNVIINGLPTSGRDQQIAEKVKSDLETISKVLKNVPVEIEVFGFTVALPEIGAAAASAAALVAILEVLERPFISTSAVVGWAFALSQEFFDGRTANGLEAAYNTAKPKQKELETAYAKAANAFKKADDDARAQNQALTAAQAALTQAQANASTAHQALTAAQTADNNAAMLQSQSCNQGASSPTPAASATVTIGP